MHANIAYCTDISTQTRKYIERLTLGLRPAAAHHSKVFAEISFILGKRKRQRHQE